MAFRGLSDTFFQDSARNFIDRGFDAPNHDNSGVWKGLRVNNFGSSPISLNGSKMQFIVLYR